MTGFGVPHDITNDINGLVFIFGVLWIYHSNFLGPL